MVSTDDYIGFSKNPFLDPEDDLERQQTSPRAPQYTKHGFLKKVSNLEL